MKKKRALGILCAAFTWIVGTVFSPLRAADSATVWSGAEIRPLAGKLHAEAVKNKIAGQTLASFPGGSCSVWMRTVSGQAELHKVQTDLMVIEEGEATLLTGGSIPDAKVSALNEVRGSSIQGATSRKVVQGDAIRIPAGTPHQFVLEPGKTLLYLAMKIPGN